MEKSQRLLWPDLIRVVAIFLMVVLHVSVAYTADWGGQTRLSWWGANLIDSYSRMCVPLFIMLSGALLLGKKESFTEFYKKRLSRLLLPWFFWSLIYGVINLIQGNETSSFTRLLVGTVWSGFWILPLFLGLYLVTPLFNYLMERNSSFFTTNFLLGMGLFMVTGGHLSLYFEFSFYFVLGYVLSTINITKRIFLLSSIGMIISWLMIASFTYHLSMANQSLTLDYYNYHTWPVLLLSLFSFVFYKGLSERYLSNNSLRRSINKLSVASFGIYFVHMLVFRTGINLLYFPSYIFIPIISIVVYFLSYIAISFLKKIKYLGRFVD